MSDNLILHELQKIHGARTTDRKTTDRKQNWDNRSKIKLFKLRIGQSDMSAHILYSI